MGGRHADVNLLASFLRGVFRGMEGKGFLAQHVDDFYGDDGFRVRACDSVAAFDEVCLLFGDVAFGIDVGITSRGWAVADS